MVYHVSMAPPERKRLGWAIVEATGCRRIGKVKRTNRRLLVPAEMCPCTIKERMYWKRVNGVKRERYVTTVTEKHGYTFTYPRRCPNFAEGDGVGEGWHRFHDLYGFADWGDEDEEYRGGVYASHPLPEAANGRGGWLEADEVESDVESVASNTVKRE